MRCPTLAELPSPPCGKTGWPWTEESPRQFAEMPDGSRWPRVSIVTPSYNQGRFIEEAIRSVLLQGYPDLEYILIDARSTDESIDIVRKYEPWLAYWVSEPDRGQADALRKGFDKARGKLLGWINADDLLAQGAVRALAEVYVRHPHFGIYAGTVQNFKGTPSEESREVVKQHNISFMNLLLPKCGERTRFHQPGIFFTADLYRRSGRIDPSFYYRMDYDLLLRMLHIGGRVYTLDDTLAYFRKHTVSKTGTLRYVLRVVQENYQAASRYLNDLSGEDREKLRLQYLNDLVHGLYLGLLRAQPRDAAICLRLAVTVGGLDFYPSVLSVFAHGMLVRIDDLFKAG